MHSKVYSGRGMFPGGGKKTQERGLGLWLICLAVTNTLTKSNLRREVVYSAYSSKSQPITKGSRDRNSRQELEEWPSYLTLSLTNELPTSKPKK